MLVQKRRLVAAVTLSLVQATNGFSICPTTTSFSKNARLTSPLLLLLLAKKSGSDSKTKPSRRSVKGSGGGTGFGSSGGSTTNKLSVLHSPDKKMTDKNHHHGPPPDDEPVGRNARGINLGSVDRTRANKDDLVVFRNIQVDNCRQQQEPTSHQPKKRLVQISTCPLMFTVDDFIDPLLCERVQNDGTGCYNLMFPERVSDLLFNGQESVLDGLLFNAVSSNDHNNNDNPNHSTSPYPDGVHMDTNGQVLFRHVTCILYLNTVPTDCGGATIFPLARPCCMTSSNSDDDEASTLSGSRLLLAEKIFHTRSPAVAVVPGAAAAVHSIEGRVIHVDEEYDPNTTSATACLRVQPQAGRLLIFFSRDENGLQDPRAWHAGERLRHNGNGTTVVEKRILTLFKQVDYGAVVDLPSRVQTTFEDYLAPQIQEQQRYLKGKAQWGVPIDYGGTTAARVAADGSSLG